MNNQQGDGTPADIVNSVRDGLKKTQDTENIGGKIKKGIKEYMESVDKINRDFPV